MLKTGLLLLASAAALFAQKPLLEGDPASPVRVLIYEDLQCPDCADFRVMLDKELLPRFGKKVAFEHRDFPLPKHEWARPAAIAARFFESISPELGVEFRKMTMANQKDITLEKFSQHVAKFATDHKVDPAKAAAALSDPALSARVEKDYQEAIARGVARTPTVLVNDDPFIETFPAAEIIQSIERQLGSR